MSHLQYINLSHSDVTDLWAENLKSVPFLQRIDLASTRITYAYVFIFLFYFYIFILFLFLYIFSFFGYLFIFLIFAILPPSELLVFRMYYAILVRLFISIYQPSRYKEMLFKC